MRIPLIICLSIHAITSVLGRDTWADCMDTHGDTLGATRRRRPGKGGGSQWSDPLARTPKEHGAAGWNWERINLRGFRPPSLWFFVTAATRNLNHHYPECWLGLILKAFPSTEVIAATASTHETSVKTKYRGLGHWLKVA